MKIKLLAVAPCMTLIAGAVSAAPTIQYTDFWTEVFGPNTTFVAAGNYLTLDTIIGSLDNPPALSAVATYSLDPTVVRTLLYSGDLSPGVKEFTLRLPNTSRTSAWNLAATDTSGTANGVFAAIADPEFLPLLLNLHVIGNGTTPTIAWDLPDLTNFDVDRIAIRAIDASSKKQVFSSGGLLPSTTSYTMPAGFLQTGKSYEFRVILADNEAARIENRSNTFSGVVTIPEPTTIALLGLGLAGLAASRRRKQ